MSHPPVRRTEPTGHCTRYWKSLWRAFQSWRITGISLTALPLKHQTEPSASYEDAGVICPRHPTLSGISKQHPHPSTRLLLLSCSKQDAWSVMRNGKPHLGSSIMKQLLMKRLILREWMSSDHYLSRLPVCALLYRIDVR